MHYGGGTNQDKMVRYFRVPHEKSRAEPLTIMTLGLLKASGMPQASLSRHAEELLTLISELSGMS
jgi:hypothetical protein